MPNNALKPIQSTDISLYVAVERASDPSVSRLVDRIRTGHFATLIHLCPVPETLLREVIAIDTPAQPVEVLLEEVLAGETSIVAQFVDPDAIDSELTRLES
jgi:hypothetical protein